MIQGIITEQTKIRLKELESQIAQYDFDIEQEKLRNYLTKKQIPDKIEEVKEQSEMAAFELDFGSDKGDGTSPQVNKTNSLFSKEFGLFFMNDCFGVRLHLQS